jgi:hypothetical protein
MSAEQFEAARTAGLSLEPRSPAWPLPEDAVVWDTFAVQDQGGSGTFTILVSSTDPPAFLVGQATDLPPCAGDPQL